MVITDTEAPSPPRVTNITCHGANDLLVEWRRPEITFDSVKFYRIYLNSIDGKKLIFLGERCINLTLTGPFKFLKDSFKKARA